ncbi:hypothetical protein [Streptomyces nigra]|uniref:hypothetical protein n=1 Tax=Streptomyces nigra TaxID=1827580 RepID=UPI00380F4A96
MSDRVPVSDPSPAQRRLVAGARNAERILAIGGLLAVAVVLTRLLAGGQSLQVAAVSVPVDRMWLVFTALTAAHVFTARFLALQIEEYLTAMPSAERAGWVFDEITTGANAFVHGLVSRAIPRRRPLFGYRMSHRDPSAWVARGAGALLLLAVPPWWWGTSRLHWGGNGWLVALAIVLTLINWWAGSKWLIGLSRLDAVRQTARTRARGSFTVRELSSLLPPVSSTWPRFRMEEVVSVYRRLIDHPLPIEDAAAPPAGTRGLLDGAPDSAVRSLTDSQRAAIGFTYLCVQESFPEADLPAAPWFVTDDERSRYQHSTPHEPIRITDAHERRSPWWEISN